MAESLEKSKFKLKDFIIFILLYFITIGSKEIFQLMVKGDFVVVGVISLSLVLGTFFIKHPKIYTRLYISIGLFYVFILIMAFNSTQFEYGFQKAFMGVFVPMFLFGFIYKKKWNEAELLKYFIYSILVISTIAILYKLDHGLFTRSVSFGLLGPIPFGWVNGMGLLAVALKREKKLNDFLLMVFFFLMVIWTGSKGPLLAFFIIAFFFFNRILGNKFSSKLLVGLLLISGFIFIKTYSKDIRAIKTIMAYLEDPEGYTEGVGQGSIGLREYYLDYSLDLFVSNPLLGVGFGGWNKSVTSDHKYPHNIYVELLSETGLVGILLFVLLLSSLRYKSIFGYMGLFGMICLGFSGDVSYFRYAFFPLLISTFLIKQNKKLL